MNKMGAYDSLQRIRNINIARGRPVIQEYYRVRNHDGETVGFAIDWESVMFLVSRDKGIYDDFSANHYVMVIRGEEDTYWKFDRTVAVSRREAAAQRSQERKRNRKAEWAEWCETRRRVLDEKNA